MQNQPTEVSIPATRREFIKKNRHDGCRHRRSAVVAPHGLWPSPERGKSPRANDRINVGFIGGRSGMNAHVNISSKNAAANNISQVAVCDVWSKRTAAAKAFIEKAGTGANVTTHVDYREILDRKDIDAVVIATHDPIHAAASIGAMESGKHVYCEKPLTRYLGKLAVHDVVKKTGKILQVGSQGTSAAAWQRRPR